MKTSRVDKFPSEIRREFFYPCEYSRILGYNLSVDGFPVFTANVSFNVRVPQVPARTKGAHLYMIPLHRLNGSEFWLNPDEILRAESMPDTTLTLRSGDKLVIQEKPELVRDRIVEFQARIRQVGRLLESSGTGDHQQGA